MNPVGSVRHPKSINSMQSGARRVPLARVITTLSLAIAALVIGACGSSGDGGGGPVQVGAVTVTPAATPFVSIGQTAQLSAAVVDVNGAPITDATVTWSSSNTAVATVSNTGLVTSTGNGNAVITATADAVDGTADVSVTQVIASVAVTPGTPTLVSLGATLQMTATAKDANGNAIAGQTATWSSSDNSVATVSGLGVLTAVANGGPVTVTATMGAFSGTASATVAQVVATVDVTPGATTLIAVASTVQLSAALKDALGRPVVPAPTVTWTSSNSTVAMVGPSGLVTAMATGGPVTVTATAGAQSGTATVTVTPAVANVAVTPPTSTLVSFGQTIQLTATPTDANGITINGIPITWVSSNDAVATVSATGLVTAVSNGGPVTLTATAGNKSGTAQVTVAQVVNAVAVTPGTTTLVSVGETVQLSATATDANGNTVVGAPVTWSSGNAGVASVSGSGLVTAVSNGGPVTFTATSGAKSGTATVTVAQVVNSVVVTPPATTLASIGATVQLAAAVTDANGNPVAGQTVTWTSSNNSIATVGTTGLVTSMATGGPVTITATVGSKSGTASVTVAQTVATVSVSPPATTLGAFGANVQLTATALDGNGIEVTGLPVAWSSANSLIATVSGTGLVTAVANGGPVTITATVTGKSGTASVTVAQVVNAVTVTPPTTTLTSVGATVQLSAAPVDANGNAVAGQTVSWSSSDATNSILTVSGTGLVTAVGNGGPVTLTATVGTKSGTATVTVAQDVSTVAITTQPGTPVQNGVTFATVPVVTVKDALNNGVGNQIVTVSVATGSALTFTNGTATTNASGVATFTGLSATGLVGARTLRFTAGTVQSAPSNSLTLNAGAAAAVAITTQPGSPVLSGGPFPAVPVVTVTDASGNLVSSQLVTVSVGSGGALTFTNGSATTDVGGVATFTGLTVAGLAGDRTLLFTAGTAVSPASGTVTVNAGAPATVTINTQPGSPVQSGVTFATVPIVTVKDAGGNNVANTDVTVSVATGSALTFVNGTATTNASGVATFTGLSASGLIGTRTLRFTAGSVNSANSSNVVVNAGVPATVTITTQPAPIVQTGVVFSPVPVVTVTDAATNVVGSTPVTVSVVTGDPLSFTAGTANTNASGVATFTGLVGTGGVGPRTLQFTAGTAVSVASNTVTVNGGPPASVTIQTQPGSPVQSGVMFATVPVVLVKDASSNPVAGQSVTVSVITGSALTFVAGTATTDPTGVATFTGLTASGLVGARALRFTAGSANSPNSTSVQVNAGLPFAVAINTQPSASINNGVTFPQVPVVTVTDAATNVVPTTPVTVSVATGAAMTFTNGTATTNASGVATFTGLSATGVNGARTLSFTAGTAVSAPSITVTMGNGVLAKIVVTPGVNMLLATGNTKQLLYSAQDAGGNPVAPQPALTGCTSSNTAMATVVANATGCLVTAAGTNGTVTITAAIGGITGTALVTNGQIAVVTNNLDLSVSVLNGSTVQATVATDGVGPLDVDITPDGSTAWVLNNDGSSIQLLTLGTNVMSTPSGSSNPRGVSITPDGQYAFIVRGALDPSLSILSTTDRSEVNKLAAGKAPRYVVVNSTDAWITDSGLTATTGQVLRYNRSTGTITDSIPVGNNPYGIAINAAGTFLYVSNRDGNSVSKIQLSNKAVTNIPVGSQPRGIKVTPDGSKVYVANMGGTTVSVINTTTNAVTTINGFSNPAGLAITAAGDVLYVANSGNNTVQRVTVATNALLGGTIAVGSKPMHIALRNVP